MAAGRRVNGKGDAILRNVTFVPGVLGQGVQVGRGAAFVPAEATETDFVRREGFTAGYWLRVEEPVDSASFHFTRGEGSYSGYINGAFRSVFEKQFDVDCEIEPEAWHHVVWVADAREKRLTLWFDGAYRGSTPFDGKVGGGPATLGLGMMIRDEDVPDPFGPFDGSLDEVRFYRRPLAVGEVVALYREGAKAIEARQAGGNRSPSPVAVCSPNKGLPPLEVRFDASASSDPEEDNLSFAWDFGDGVKGAGAIVTHTYAKLGKYDARLTVTDARGAAATIEKSIRVQNEAPRLQVYPAWNWRLPKGEKAVAPDEVRLDASESVDPEGKPLRCTWSVADQTYTGAVVRARLPAPGAYPLTLVADDGTGRTTTWRGTVNLADAGGRCLAETPAEPLTPGLHFRYFHQGARHPGMDIEGHAVYPIEWNVLKHYGSAHVPLPWIVRARPLQYWIDWAGYLNAPADGDYTFHFNVKGGAFLWIGSRLVGNWYQGYGSTRDREFRDFTVKLQQGAHRFRLVYFAYKYENQNLAITWSGPGFTNQLIPSAAFNRSLSVAEQRAAGLANPRPGADVADWFQESNPPSEGPAPQPPPKIGRLELTVSDPAADGYVTVRAKAPADFVEPIEIVCHPGDGSRVAGAEFARVYPPGAYTITVEARDAAGRSAAAFRKIAVPAREAVESIGFVFTRGRDFLRPTSVAGVFPQGFWNASGPSSSGETVLDSQGRKVAVTLSSAEQLPWNPVYTGSTSPMEDQLLAAAGWFDARELSIRGIPYARYDLVLIAPGGWDAGVPASFAVTIGDQTRTVRTVRAPSDFAGRYVEETEANPEGNYLVFRGLTGTDQTIRLPKIITGKRPSICAVQIVKTK
jgi:PKD repeat protein